MEEQTIVYTPESAGPLIRYTDRELTITFKDNDHLVKWILDSRLVTPNFAKESLIVVINKWIDLAKACSTAEHRGH